MNSILRRESLLQSLTRAASIWTMLVGILVLIGWMFDLPFLKSILPGFVTMKANTAICFVLLGFTLYLLQKNRPATTSSRTWQQNTALASPILVAVIAALTLSEYLFEWDAGINELLFSDDPLPVATASPGRMAPATAINFLLLALVLLISQIPRTRTDQSDNNLLDSFAIVLNHAVAVSSFIAILGYLYGVEPFSGLFSNFLMAIHTSLTFLILSSGLICFHSNWKMVHLLVADDAGGASLRVLLPSVTIIIVIIGLLRIWGENAGLYSTEFGVALNSVAIILLILPAVWWNAFALSRSDQKRHELTENLKQLNTKLETANKELEAFSYSVSHDLRAPLRHIDGFTELLLKRAAESLDDQSKRYLHTIAGAAKHMGALIDDLLVFSRMGRTEMRKSHYDSDALVHEAIGSLSHETAGREIDWNVNGLPAITADREMLSLVFQNLLGNAVKYTRPRPQARIEIGCTTSGSELVFCVRDNGVGFDMKYVDKLFGVFQRLHRADEFEGTGIGLANVRRIISRHGGRTWAEGVTNGGAAFFFTLPIETVNEFPA